MRRRRSFRPRSKSNYTWQVWEGSGTDMIPANSVASFALSNIGLGIDVSDTEFDAFDHQVTLERIRGYVVHEAEGDTPSTTSIVPVSIGMFAVPAEVASGIADMDTPNLFLNGEGDDYPFMHNSICDAASTVLYPNLHPVDVKARRRYDVGTQLVMAATARNRDTSRTVTLTSVWNFRLLWKLP